MANTTPNHSLPYPQAADDAVPHTDIRALAEAVDTELDQIAPGQIVGPTAGQILIANGSGQITGVAMSGDAIITPAGEVTIGSKKISTAKLDDKAVTTAKLDDKAVTRAKTSGWIQSGRATAPGSTAVGAVDISWPTAFSNASYHAVATLSMPSGASNNPTVTIVNKTASGIRVRWEDHYPAAGSFAVEAIAIA